MKKLSLLAAIAAVTIIACRKECTNQAPTIKVYSTYEEGLHETTYQTIISETDTAILHRDYSISTAYLIDISDADFGSKKRNDEVTYQIVPLEGSMIAEYRTLNYKGFNDLSAWHCGNTQSANILIADGDTQYFNRPAVTQTVTESTKLYFRVLLACSGDTSHDDPGYRKIKIIAKDKMNAETSRIINIKLRN